MSVTASDPMATRRSPLTLVVVAAVVLTQGLAIYEIGRFFAAPSAGLMGFWHLANRIYYVGPTTPEAATAMKGLVEPVELRAVDGRAVTELADAFVAAIQDPSFVASSPPGVSHRFELEDRRGIRRDIVLQSGSRDIGLTIRAMPRMLASHGVGLLYLLMGLWVWWRRPRDPAANGLLYLCVAALCNLTLMIYRPGLEFPVALARSLLPFWGAAALHFGQAFTGSLQSRGQRRLVAGYWVGALLISMALFYSFRSSFEAPGSGGIMMRGLLILTGVFALSAILLLFWRAWHTCHAPRPLALQRRAKTLAAAMILGYGFPSLSLILGPLGILPDFFETVNLACFAVFPLLMGLSILRHHSFELRIVLRSGLVYAVLSLAVSLGYLGLVALVARLVHRAPSPLFIGISVATAVVVFGLVQVRVQRAIDRFVYRSRYVYAEAITRASAALSRELTPEAMVETVRASLIDAMSLSNAYLVLKEHGAERMRCHQLGPHPQASRVSAALPSSFAEPAYEPIARAAASGQTVSAHDTVAIAAQSTELSNGTGPEPHSEADFWLHFGVDSVVPLRHGAHAGADSHHVVGYLVVGAKLDGRHLDPEDRALVHTLANQISVALISAEAFIEIQRLNEGLEEEVLDRTRELSEALDALKSAQGQLLESEMQAVLARLVAGVVHEVNTPLGSLRSAVDTIQRTMKRVRPLLEAQRDDGSREVLRMLRAIDTGHTLVEVLKTSGERIQGVVGSLQRFINLDEAEKKAIDVRRSIDDVLTLLSAQLTDGLEIHKDFPAVPAMVTCYPARLNNVFLNILQNAIAAVEGGGNIAIEVEDFGDAVAVTIVDDGKGIPSEGREELFQIGFTTKEGGRVGLRLGLPLAKRWVEELGGRLRLDSEEGRGTRVRVLLPIVEPSVVLDAGAARPATVV